MSQIHNLLKRQLRRHFGDQFTIPKKWQGFIDAVNDAYEQSDTDRRMLERSLELSSQELLHANSEMRAVFQAIPDLLFRLDSEGTILAYEAAGDPTHFFLQPQALLGKRIQDIPSQQAGDRFRQAIRQVRTTRSTVSIEYPLVLQDQEHFYEARLRPLLEDQIVVMIRDITVQKQAEETLRRAKGESERYAGDLERRALQVQTASEVSRAASSILDPDELIQEVVNLVRERFNLYYAGLFLIDQSGEPGKWVVLRAGTGEAGRQMVEQGHKLEIGGESMIGWCVANQRARIALDVTSASSAEPGTEAVRFDNPYLPHTRSELALPLVSRGQALGAMTIQSEQEAAFSDEDIATLQTMADQVATAIENARLFDQQQQARSLLDERLKELDCLNDVGRKIDEGPLLYEFLQWVTERVPPAMQHPDVCLAAIELGGHVYGAAEALQLPQQMVGSLRTGGEVTGRVVVAYSEDHDFIDEESALLGDIVRRVNGYVENQRLLEQAQQRAAQLEWLALIEATLSQAANEEEILTNISMSVDMEHPPDRISLQYLETDEDEQPATLYAVSTWHDGIILPDDPDLYQHRQVRELPTSQLWLEAPNETSFISDLQVDPRADKQLRQQAAQLGFQALALMPLHSAGRWQGLVTFLWSEPHLFSPDERFYLHQLLEPLSAVVASRRAYLAQQEARAESEHRALQIQTATEISRTISSILDPDELIQEVVNLMRERFNLYYAGLFLVDQTGARTGEPNRWAVLRAGTGEAGQQMLARSHKLEIGGESMIGRCVANQRARIALDVGAEAVRFDNPYLPHTRSELALPLVSRGRARGAVSIQSSQADAFSDEDIAIFQTMVDQVATAIENARLLEETRSALAEVEATHSRYLRREWQEYLSQRTALRQGGFLYDQTQAGAGPDDSAQLVAGLWRPEIERAVSARHPVRVEDDGVTEPVGRLGEAGRTGLAIPIIVRGQTIGVLGVEDPAGTHQWSEEDEALMQAIGQQLGLALENARLLEDTQRRAVREQLIGEVTAHIRESLDVDTVLQTAVREMQAALDLSEVELRMGNNT